MEEALIKRVMPHDEEAESSVIGAMLIDNEAIMVASEIITGDDFYQKQLGIVFDTMVELYNAGKPVEPVILHTSLLEKGLPEEACGIEQILRWMDRALTSANIKYYAEIVAEKSVARRLIRINEEIANVPMPVLPDWKIHWRMQRSGSLNWHREAAEETSCRSVRLLLMS